MTRKLWGGRFPKKNTASVEEFTSSISFDQRLAKYDILGSIAHAKMLGRQKIIPAQEAKLLVKGLKTLLKDAEENKIKFSPQAEDIHSEIQNLLYKRIGETAYKLHTARSRNDQVALDVKLYLKEELDEIITLITQLQKSVLQFAEDNFGIIVPGYTHLQRAQCVLLSHHLLAYIEALQRDKERIIQAKERLDTLPLGSLALTGTGLPIDREMLRKELKFKKITENSIDSVADRDFILEVLADLSIMAMHFSRIAEDLILWASQEFAFLDIDFAFCTGSSIMPHKKNPDVLELIRGSSAKVFGDFSTLWALLKGLPYAYNRDLQLDKPALFDSIDTIKQNLKIFKELFLNLSIKEAVLKEKLKDEALFSVDIMEYLIKKGIPYPQAHNIVGRMVNDCLDKGKKIADLSQEELKQYSAKLSLEIKDFLNARASVKLKTSLGATSALQVKRQIKKWRFRLKD